jgi:2-methylisocitrate lyase-like PEP mutase family enzyme
MTEPSSRTLAFRALHESGCFVIPNPWDAGGARMLQGLGFRALASTSAGFAWSLGQRDNSVMLDEILAHLKSVCASVTVPVNADFEGGFSIDPEGVATNVTFATETGISGLSIEDSTGDANDPLYDFTLSVERIAAARSAIDATGTGVMLTGRSEGFICGRPDIDETVKRLRAYAEVGADCLYAPGIRTDEHIRAVISAVAPKPVNVLVGGNWTTVGALAALGVRRVSLGGSLARAAWTGAISAAKEIAELGSFNGVAGAVSFTDIERAIGARD